MNHAVRHDICTPVECAPCEIPQLARNTFFDGKPMSAQDFLDEQNYLLGKLRRHNQYLHGWGVACGLIVGEHPNPACRDRYVTVSPGAAVDCCGREILVRSTQMVDIQGAFLAAWRQTYGPKSKPDDQAHRVELVLRYRECPADPVPAVFEGCGADASACLPGKLVDGFEFGVLLDRQPEGMSSDAVKIEWECTNNIDHVRALALSVDGKALYALTGVSPALLVGLEPATRAITASAGFAGFSGVDVALSADGKHVLLVLRPDAAGDPELRVLDAANIAAPALKVVPLTGAAAGDVKLLALADGRLAAASPVNNTVWVWDTDVVANATPTAITVANGPLALAAGPMGQWLYAAVGAAAEVVAIKLSDLSTVTLPVGSGGTARPVALAAGARANRDTLAIADGSNGSLHLMEVTPDAATPTDRTTALGAPVTTLVGKPVALAMSAGAHWVFALLAKADGSSALQAVSIDRRAAGTEPSIGAEVTAPPGSVDMLVGPDGRLLIGFDGAPAAADPRQPGGIATYKVAGGDCLAIFDKLFGPCPACEEGDEIVLAAITKYVWEQPVLEAMIDNRVRRLLPSTTILAEVIRCIADCSGGKGEPGKDGKDGTNGTNGTSGTNGTNGTNGVDGKDGVGLRDDLPRIVGINWPHGGDLRPGTEEYDRIIRDGLVVAFDQASPILANTLHPQSCQLLAESVPRADDGRPEFILDLTVWYNVTVKVSPVDVQTRCGDERFDVPRRDAAGPATTGVRMRWVGREGRPIRELPPGTYRVILEGDHILADKEIEIDDFNNPGETIKVHPALDANHFAPGVGNGRCPTGDRVEGGRFVSWFTVASRG